MVSRSRKNICSYFRKIIGVVPSKVLESCANHRMLRRVYLHFMPPTVMQAYHLPRDTCIYPRCSRPFAYVCIHRHPCRYIRATCCGAIFTEVSASSTKTDTYCKSLPHEGPCISESITDLWRETLRPRFLFSSLRHFWNIRALIIILIAKGIFYS